MKKNSSFCADARQIIRHSELVSESQKMSAFTLAEVLTTLVIIGVVAAITAPILQSTISEHIMEKQRKVFERKFEQNMHNMQLKGELAKSYSTTMDFVKTMQKYMNITKVCDKDHLTECFADKIMQNKRQKKYDVSTLRTAGDVDINFSEEYDPDLVGVVFADGVSAIIAQDPECLVSDKYNQVADVTYCLGMYYDVNGLEGPNILDNDILTMNVGTKAVELEMGEAFVPTCLDVAGCEKAKQKGVPINNQCTQSVDCWAGAAQKCFNDGGRLPSRVELQEIAQRVYGSQNIIFSGATKGLNVADTTLWGKLDSPDSGVFFWSSEESAATASYGRYFSSSSTNGADYGRSGYSNKAFCLGVEPPKGDNK